MPSLLAAVLCTGFFVLCVGGPMHSETVDHPQIVDSVKVVIFSKQDDDGKWMNEVKLEHGTEQAPWKVEVEQKTLDRGGRKSVELTATLTGPKPSPKTTVAQRGVVPEHYEYRGTLQDQAAARPEIPVPWHFRFLNSGTHIGEPTGPQTDLPGGFQIPNPGYYLEDPNGPQMYGPRGFVFPNSGQRVIEPTGPQIPLPDFRVPNPGYNIKEPARPQIYIPGSIEFPNQGQHVGEPTGPGGISFLNHGASNGHSQQFGIRHEAIWRGSQYKLSYAQWDWVTANKSCTDAGSHLVIINSEEEALFVASIILYYGHQDAFVGITDEGQEGNWVTIEGLPIATTGFSRWFRSDQPDNQNDNENCGSIISSNGGLNDVPCTGYRLHTICEKEEEPMNVPVDNISPQDDHDYRILESILESDEANIVQVSEDPESDFTQFPGFSSFYKVHTRQMDWETANKACFEEGAYLAVINSEEEAIMMAQLLKQLYGDNYRGAFVGITDEAEEDETLAETGFANGNKKCGAIFPANGGLYVVPCTEYLLHSICQKDVEPESNNSDYFQL